MMTKVSVVSAMALAMVWGASAQALAASGHPPAGRDDTPYLQVAGLFGESDEEKAARLAAEKRENDQEAAIADLKSRVQDLERALQQSTSQSETLLRRVQDLKATTDKLQKDLDYKLCSVTAQLMGVSVSAGDGGISCDGKGVVAAGVGGAGDAPQTRKAYDDGMKLLARAQYDEALASFRSFLDANPKDDLAPQALYWIGNIDSLKHDYAGAAEAFADGIKKYGKSPRGPDFMMKLGEALIAMGQQKEGCVTLAAVKTKYPKGPAGILSQAASLHAKSCK